MKMARNLYHNRNSFSGHAQGLWETYQYTFNLTVLTAIAVQFSCFTRVGVHQATGR